MRRFTFPHAVTPLVFLLCCLSVACPHGTPITAEGDSSCTQFSRKQHILGDNILFSFFPLLSKDNMLFSARKRKKGRKGKEREKESIGKGRKRKSDVQIPASELSGFLLLKDIVVSKQANISGY